MEYPIKSKIIIPRYQQIALEIATRIVSEEYKEGSKIYARSSIASQFGVSPETARRAICILCDLNIVSSEKGSGVMIKSQKNATTFVKQFTKRKTIETIKENIFHIVEHQKQEMDSLNQHISELVTASEHFRSMNPFMPFEICITNQCSYLDKNLSEIQFWQNTGATVLAVCREHIILRSPGPYISLLENDILYFLPQDDSTQRVKDFLYPIKE